MNRILLLLSLQSFAFSVANSQSFNVNDLLALTSMPQKTMVHLMSKRKFSPAESEMENNIPSTLFLQKIKNRRSDEPERSVVLYNSEDTKYYILHTASKAEYLDGQARLIKAGFIYDTNKDFGKEASMFYQKRNITIEAITETKDDIAAYTFILRQKEMPDLSTIRYGEDLLQFTSHEFLVSFFGESNVKKDRYYFSEKALKKCSVLFGGSNRQVVFVWKDEINLSGIEYILISTKIPTESGANTEKVLNTNEWKLKSGIHHGTDIKELLRLNENDFEIYGNNSDLAFMIEPAQNGNIDFKKTALLLTCKGCNNDALFDKKTVSALDVAKKDLPVSVFDIIIYPDTTPKNVVGIVTK
ncbi:MAG: hypothetical protein M3015_09270 [Bacteroidota bacterium]|nr:hypothetical protein [Bacteroidota bacterium]